jgi:hypothetical protein
MVMSWYWLLHLLSEFAFLLLVFGATLFVSIKWGRQTITNLIFGLYVALLLFGEFPYHSWLAELTEDPGGQVFIQLLLYGVLAVTATAVFVRVLPREYDEGAFESFGAKSALAAAATILVLIVSYQVLPVGEFVAPETPLATIFSSEPAFFYWLLMPLVVLCIV